MSSEYQKKTDSTGPDLIVKKKRGRPAKKNEEKGSKKRKLNTSQLPPSTKHVDESLQLCDENQNCFASEPKEKDFNAEYQVSNLEIKVPIEYMYMRSKVEVNFWNYFWYFTL